MFYSILYGKKPLSSSYKWQVKFQEIRYLISGRLASGFFFLCTTATLNIPWLMAVRRVIQLNFELSESTWN
ncbi:hypothetical protein BC349_01140 [Flavihumibacter stibioxidans]|uniref:Uncharacterized protein n=1 Tax=Flavihumibacter stibioxidans TaxID=1834163 RepID=A0ABR7M3G1_9BACT|nr:hypothetical protein [Flavihumibacter stibioxidans]